MRKEKRAAYQREWRKKNPLKMAEINVKYWSRRLEELREGRGIINVKG